MSSNVNTTPLFVMMIVFSFSVDEAISNHILFLKTEIKQILTARVNVSGYGSVWILTREVSTQNESFICFERRRGSAVVVTVIQRCTSTDSSLANGVEE